jgi:hypothetical protein
LRSLPTVSACGRWVDLAVLAAADLPLLVLFAAAITSALLHRGPAFPAVLAMLALAPQLPLFQSMQLQRISGRLPCLALDLAGMAANAAGWNGWLLPFAAIASTAAGIAFLARPPRLAAGRSWTLPACLRLHDRWRVECNLALVNLRCLLGERHYAQHIRLAFCALLPVLLQALLRHTSVSTWPPFTTAAVLVSLCLPPLVLGLSSLATELRSLHAPMLAMQRTLGIRPSHLRTAQLLALGTSFIPLCIPLMLTLYLAYPPGAHSWRVLAVVPVGTLALAACCWLMEFPYNRVYLPRIVVAVSACYGVVHWLPG